MHGEGEPTSNHATSQVLWPQTLSQNAAMMLDFNEDGFPSAHYDTAFTDKDCHSFRLLTLDATPMQSRDPDIGTGGHVRREGSEPPPTPRARAAF